MADQSAGRHRPLCVGLALTLPLVTVLILHFTRLDGVTGLLWSALVDSDTEYSSGYSDRRFRSVRAGDDRATVLNQLGEPLARLVVEHSTWPGPVEYWFYSRSPTNGSYRRRQVVFDSGGRVIETQSFFDVD